MEAKSWVKIRAVELSQKWNCYGSRAFLFHEQGCGSSSSSYSFLLKIDRYGFFEADTDISAIDGLIADTDNWYFQNF